MTQRRPPSALRALLASGLSAGQSDDQLLQKYVDRRAEADAAFAALVDRHGPMVWGVCRRVLGDHADAEDAFQATFLILARRAGAVRVDGSLGRWLHGVARRVASRARADRRNRRTREAQAATAPPNDPPPDAERAELLAAIDDELGRLPEKYRAPLILCHLEGLTYAEAADRLGCPRDTLKGRLARARDLLRSRLARRGFGPPPAPALLLAPEASAPPPPALVTRTASVLGRSAPAPAVLSLVNGVHRTMTLIHLTRTLAFLAPATFAAWALAAQVPAPEPAPPTAAPRAPALQPIDPSTALSVPLPGPEDLHRLLRRISKEAIQLTHNNPNPYSHALQTIASAQAMAGDRDGARETFAAACRDLKGPSDFRQLLLIGHYQVRVGLDDDARGTFRHALKFCPTPTDNSENNYFNQMILGELVEDLMRLGERNEARRVAGLITAFAGKSLNLANVANQEEVDAPTVAAALATVGDLDGAFATAKNFYSADQILGQAALAAAKYLDPPTAKLFIDRVLDRLAGIAFADLKASGLSYVANAQAHLGDIEGARRSARLIGEGPNRFEHNMIGWRPATLREIASVQLHAGDPAGAAVTLREAYGTYSEHPNMPNTSGHIPMLAETQINAGDLEGALKTVGLIHEGGRAFILVDIARAQAAAGNVAASRRTVNLALADARSEVKPPPDPNVALLARMGMGPIATDSGKLRGQAQLQALFGDVPAALRTVAAISDERYRSITLQGVAKARAEAGDVAGAFRIATESAKSPEERRMALEGIGRGVESRLWRERLARPAR